MVDTHSPGFSIQTTRSGTAAEWAVSDLVLGPNELGLLVDADGKVIERRFGDGVSLWPVLDRVRWPQIVVRAPETQVEWIPVTGVIPPYTEPRTLAGGVVTGTSLSPSVTVKATGLYKIRLSGSWTYTTEGNLPQPARVRLMVGSTQLARIPVTPNHTMSESRSINTLAAGDQLRVEIGITTDGAAPVPLTGGDLFGVVLGLTPVVL